MKNLLILCSLLLASCLTSADLKEIEDAMADRTKNDAEVRATIDDVVAKVNLRTDNFLSGLSSAEAASGLGGLSVLTGIGLNLYRNSQRRKRGEVVGNERVPPPAAAPE